MQTPITDLVVPHLPYLRRFARALTGTQERGDAYVVATLETIIADQSTFNREIAPKTALYRSLLQVWNAMPMNRHTDNHGASWEGTADNRIDALAPRTRQAFLLAALEEFSTSEIATILGTSDEEVSSLINASSREISKQIATKVMIIEDEPLVALDIEALITDIGHEVAGIATTRTEAVALAERTRPGLILADIQLADGSSGIDTVNDILQKMSVPVIFVTAYPERLLTGERPEPAFLITKPFKPDMVKAVISQALFFDMRAGVKRGAAA